ncbi:hypothetical protein Emed_001515 [Eimeria media]
MSASHHGTTKKVSSLGGLEQEVGNDPLGQHPSISENDSLEQQPYTPGDDPLGQQPYTPGDDPLGQHPYIPEKDTLEQDPSKPGKDSLVQEPYTPGDDPLGQHPYLPGKDSLGKHPSLKKDPLGQNPLTPSPSPVSGSEPTVQTFRRQLRKLSSTSVSDTVGRFLLRLRPRIAAATRPFVYPINEEARGQTNLSKLVFKLKVYTWVAKKVKKLRNFLQSIFPSETDETTLLSDGNSTIPVHFTRELHRDKEFIDLLAQEDKRDWVGRFYVETPGQGTSTAMEKDFAILNCAPPDESIESFRHRMRLDIPIEIYTIQSAGDYLKAPDGQVFINAVARKPLVQASTSKIMKWFLKKLKNTKKGKSSLLSMSQQAVTAVSNLHRLSLVHTNINPDVFLVTQKGLVFLGGLHQAVTEGSVLPQTRAVKPGFTPPELRGQEKTTTRAAFSQDAWQLGATILTFWCGEPVDDESGEVLSLPMAESGTVSFDTCSRFTPDEIKDLITSFTQPNPENRLLPEKAQRLHPAMRLPVTDGAPPTVDLDQDDDEFDV